MPAEPQPNAPPPSLRPGIRLRQAGLLILLVGFATAGVVYFLNVYYPPRTPDNSLLDGYYKSQSAQMQKFWGNLGPVALTLRENLQPAWPAILIALLSIVSALTCFHFAHRRDRAEGSERACPGRSNVEY